MTKTRYFQKVVDSTSVAPKDSFGLKVKAMLDSHFAQSNFYTLPFYYCGHAISKTISLSYLALLLPVVVNFDPPKSKGSPLK